MLALVILTVATALVFDFTNGFHDTANAMATTIATRALPPRIAVGLAAVLNLVGAFLSVTVAATIASGIVDQTTITVPIIFAGLVGRDRLERDHLVHGHPVLVVARAGRRRDRLGARRRGLGRRDLERRR